MFIPDPDPDFLTIQDPGSRGQKCTGPGPGSATLLLRSHHEVKKIKDKKRLHRLLWVNINQRLYSKSNVGYGTTVWDPMLELILTSPYLIVDSEVQAVYPNFKVKEEGKVSPRLLLGHIFIRRIISIACFLSP